MAESHLRWLMIFLMDRPLNVWEYINHTNDIDHEGIN